MELEKENRNIMRFALWMICFALLKVAGAISGEAAVGITGSDFMNIVIAVMFFAAVLADLNDLLSSRGSGKEK